MRYVVRDPAREAAGFYGRTYHPDFESAEARSRAFGGLPITVEMDEETEERRKRATWRAIAKIAYHTAREARGKRREDAVAHCRRIGVDPEAPTFEEAFKE